VHKSQSKDGKTFRYPKNTYRASVINNILTGSVSHANLKGWSYNQPVSGSYMKDEASDPLYGAVGMFPRVLANNLSSADLISSSIDQEDAVCKSASLASKRQSRQTSSTALNLDPGR